MFKKALEAKGQQRLSGADRKKLRRTAKERFQNASDADIDLILPPKTEVTVSKYPNRVLVYSVQNEGEPAFPMLFDVDGRGIDIFPTDLMFPGISIPAEGVPPFQAGQPWAVTVPNNVAPIAVGTTTMSSTEALKAGLRGKALRITHCYRDSLWQGLLYRESVEGHYVPNAGFLEDVVLKDPALALGGLISDSCGGTCNTSSQHNGTNGEVADIGDVDSEHHLDKPHIEDYITEEIISETSGLKITGDTSVEASNEKDQHDMSTEEVDSLLDRCLLQALYTTVKDKDLPMPGSTLCFSLIPISCALPYDFFEWPFDLTAKNGPRGWSSHVLPCRPPGMTLDIKKSSHKKLSKWLQSKSSAGLISAKEDKYKKEVILLAVKRTHPDYTSFRPEKRQKEIVDNSIDQKADEGQQHKMQLELVEIYKPSVHVNPVFLSVGASTVDFYSALEATDVVFKYVEKENLVKPANKAIVVLDATLCDALFKGTIKKGSSYPTEVHKKDLSTAFLSRMQAHHRVTRGTETIVRKGALKTVQIMTERRQGNKKMTRVSGLESFLIDAEALASELQKKLACSTTVAELPGKKGYEVLAQGGVIDNLAKHLVEHYGIPKRYIEVLDKTRK
ncbi:hypothetical protein IFM89_039644 [Coptis chinensis]|uniref:SUI1 domain-containing protein n=1 Tax=Coptis chinensis TaxID=261450 RepID=A0A835GWG0_9MAGN|nr:hypothetical protein IFM89_039644 [Coptis chinensis]